MSDWCGGDCVWMGPEVERLTKENAALRDLVKRLVKELEPFCDGGCERDDVVKAACDELRKENDRQTRKP